MALHLAAERGHKDMVALLEKWALGKDQEKRK
jgi:hypothetical protein